MIQKECRASRASKYFGGGGGGGGGIDYRNWRSEQPQIRRGYRFQQRQLDRYGRTQPLLAAAQTSALANQEQLSSLTTPQTTALSQYVAPTLASGGALSSEAARNVAQQTRTIASAQGAARSPGALGTELLNREQYRQQRFNQALTQAQGIGSSVQGLQTGGINQLLGVQQNRVGTYTQLQNPILGYLGSMFGGNLQAQVAQSGIAAQQQAASDAKTGQLIGSAISSIGSVAGAAAMSDERLKTKIRDTGLKSEEGIPLKFYEFKTRPGVSFIGPLAQDVEKKRPDAVITDPVSGVKMVDFYKLRAPMIELDPYGGKEAA
jgi:hypothetical protein